MSETILNFDDLPKVPLDEAGRIIVGVTCRGCGYNLRGLTPDGVCPECAIAIGRSLKGDLLQYCDPAWVDRLDRGMRWVIAGTIAGICLGIAGAVVVGALGRSGTAMSSLVIAIVSVVASVATLVTVIGVWLVTSPEAGGEDSESIFSARQISRWGVAAGIVSSPLQISWNRGGVALGATTSPMITFFAVMAWILAAIVLAGHAAGFVYLRRLALRIPDDSLAGQTRTVLWGYVATQGIGLAIAVLAVLAAPILLPVANPGPMLIVVIGGGCLSLLGILIFGVWALVLLFRYRAAFERTAARARATWASPPGSIDPDFEVDLDNMT